MKDAMREALKRVTNNLISMDQKTFLSELDKHKNGPVSMLIKSGFELPLDGLRNV